MSGLLDHFSQPWYLLLALVALPIVFILGRHSLAGASSLRSRVSIVVRSTVVLCLILSLAECRRLSENERLAVIFLVDRSASVPDAYQQQALELARMASEYRDRDRTDAVGVISFGRNAGIERPVKNESLDPYFDFQTFIEKDYTDFQGAIRLALAAFPEGYAKRLVLISDGNENRGSALEEARRAAGDGVQIDVLPVRYDYKSEILLDKLVVDPNVHVGEPFEIRVVVESTGEANATLRIFENQSVLHTEKVALEPGKNVFRVSHTLQRSDLYYFRAVLEPEGEGKDVIIQNNTAMAFTHIHGQPKILLCSDEPSLDASLVAALQAENITADVIKPGALPTDAARYLQYDSVIFSNVSLFDITNAHAKMFENLVKGAGLGFVMIGGDRSFGAGGYLGSAIERMLPVYMDAQQKKKLPNGALAIVMHSCEINNGNYWAKQTIKQSIQVLSPRDYAGVIYYDWQGGDRWLFPMMPCTNKQLMLNRLTNFAPGDMPSFRGIMQKAYTQLANTPAAIKHIIIFTDGDPSQPSQSLVQQIVNAKITISTICMGPHSQPYAAAMQGLAQAGGGKFYRLTGPEDLPEIFIREASVVRKALIDERDFAVIPHRGDSFLTGIDVQRLPILQGYVVTSAKEQADHFLSAPGRDNPAETDPILSSWHYGLGKSVAFTSDAGRRWAGHWASWQGYRQFWSQVVRWASRSRSDDSFRVTRTREGDTGVVFIDAIDPSGRFLNGIEFEGTVITPGGDAEGTEVRQIGPGRYRAEFPVQDKGVYLTSFKYQRDGEGKVYSTGVTIPYSPEFRRLATNDLLMRRVAESTGGKSLETSVDEGRYDEVFRAGFTTTRDVHDWWRELLILAILLFFVDVFIRRVAVDYVAMASSAMSKFSASRARKRREAEAQDERLGALLKRKSKVQETQGTVRRFYSAEASQDEGGGEARPSFDASYDAGAEQATKPATPSRASRKKTTPEATPEEDGYTSRLLEAKKRALREKQKKQDREGGRS